MEISEMIAELRENGYVVKKVTPQMRDHSEECMEQDARGEGINCYECACSICVMQ